MIRVEGLTAHVGRLLVRDVSFGVTRGVHALVGARDDGPPIVLSVLAGELRARAGNVSVMGGRPGDPNVRPAVAHVALAPALPDAMRVAEVLDLAAEIRNDERLDARERLASLGVASLANRKIRSLSHDEARAVAMAEALTSRRVEVVLLEEPFLAMEPRAAASLAGCIRARAAKGACILVATASPRDAAAVADTQLTFDRGTLVRHSDILDPIASAPAGTTLRVLSDNPRALLGAVSSEPSVMAFEARGGVLFLGGTDLVAVAAAIARAALKTGVVVHEIRREAPMLEETRAAGTGAATAAFHLAYERARAAMAPPRPPPSPTPTGEPAR